MLDENAGASVDAGSFGPDAGAGDGGCRAVGSVGEERRAVLRSGRRGDGERRRGSGVASRLRDRRRRGSEAGAPPETVGDWGRRRETTAAGVCTRSKTCDRRTKESRGEEPRKASLLPPNLLQSLGRSGPLSPFWERESESKAPSPSRGAPHPVSDPREGKEPTSFPIHSPPPASSLSKRKRVGVRTSLAGPIVTGP